MLRPLLLPRYDRYIIFSYLKMTLLCFLGMILLIVVIDNMENMDEFIKYSDLHDISWWNMLLMMAEHYAAYAPALFMLWMSSGLLVMAGMIVTLQVGLSREFTIMRASGVSMTRAVLPIIFITLLLGCLISLTRDYYMPAFLRKSYDLSNKLRPDEAKPIMVPIADGDTRRLILMGFFDNQQGIARNLRIDVWQADRLLQDNEQFRCTVYEAKAASLQPRQDPDDPDDDHLNQWVPEGEARVYDLELGYQSPPRPWVEPLPSYITHAMLERQTLGQKVMTWSDLSRRSEELDMKLELAERTSAPFSSAIILFVALPLVLRATVRGESVNYVRDAILALGVFAIYQLLRATLLGWGGDMPDIISPWMAAHGANIVYLLVGFYLFFRLER